MKPESGKYYMISALKRRHADRIPLTVLIGPYCSRLTPYSVREILTDAPKSAEAHLAFYRRFEPDSLIIYNDIYLEAEAIGREPRGVINVLPTLPEKGWKLCQDTSPRPCGRLHPALRPRPRKEVPRDDRQELPAGNVTVTVVPSPGELRSSMVPPWAWTMRRA